MKQRQNNLLIGFTIVELLVVIVVIGILATITISTYNGIVKRAVEASVRSDLANAAKQIKVSQAINNQIPLGYDCLQTDSATNKCLKSSSGNYLGNFSVSNGASGQVFCLDMFNGDSNFYITNGSGPLAGSCPVLRQISVGAVDSCSIYTDNYAYCWGYNNYGQVGDNTSGTSRLTPTSVYRLGDLSGLMVKSISIGDFHSCAIASDDNAYCWGNNSNGRVGDNTSGTNRLQPVRVYKSNALNGLTIKMISAAGAGNTCAIASDNNAYCWGGNGSGQIGDGTSGTSRLEPTQVYKSGALNGLWVKSLSVGAGFACAIASDNNAYCWGGNGSGQIGDGTSGTNRLSPTAVSKSGALSGKFIKAIATGDDHACAIASDDNLYCWGYNYYGQIGDGTSGTNRLSPVPVDTGGILGGKTIKAVAARRNNTCVIASDNNAYCWGDNSFGQVGDNTSGNFRSSPVEVNRSGVLNNLQILQISISDHACALASDYHVYCWGYNSYGQVGNNTSGNNQLLPLLIQ